ncbi:MAG: AsmA family protein [Magnetococcales bacterium]|nr:AsmA family protein [Magnetococcales bacterium]
MNRKLRGVLYGAGGALLLVVAGVLSVPLLVHPNQYRAPIAALVQNVTGRTLTIQGEVGLALFPSVEIILRDLTLANAPEFAPDPMVRVETVKVGVKFVPLLSGRVEVDRAEMSGLSLHLRRNAAGQSNWDDLVARARARADQGSGTPGEPVTPGESVTPPREIPVQAPVQAAKAVRPVGDGGGATVNPLSVGSIEVIGAKIFWRDETRGSDWQVNNLEIKTGHIIPGRPVSVSMGWRFLEEQHDLRGRADLKYQLRLASGMMWLDGLEANVRATAVHDWLKEAHARLTTDLVLNLRSATGTLANTAVTANLWSSDSWWRDVALGWRGGMELDLAQKRLMAPKSLFTAQIKANDLPPAGVQLRVNTDLVADLGTQTLQMTGLDVEGPAGTRLKGGVETAQLSSAPVTRGSLTVERFDFRTLLIALGRTIPAESDAKVYSGVDAALDFSVSGQELEISRMNVGVDDSRLTGTLGMRSSGPEVRFDWVVDTLDLDRYLPMPGEEGREPVVAPPSQESAGQGSSPSGATPAPKVEGVALAPWLTRELLVDGKVRFGRLVVARGRFTDVEGGVVAREGVLSVDPLTSALYGGRLESKARLANQEPLPVATVEATLRGVRAGPMLQEMAGQEGVSGTVDLGLRLEARGQGREALLQSMNGDLRLGVQEGVVPGMDVVGRIRNAYATFKRVRPTPAAGADETRFSEMTGTALVQNGVLTNKDLLARSPLLLVNGGGQVDFVQRRVDYQLSADVAASLQGVVPEVEKYQGLVLPLHLRGSFDSLKKFEAGSVDFSRLLTNSLRERVMDKVGEKLGEEEKGKINQGLEQLEKKLGAPVNQLLQKFLQN